ncbi:R-SNARE family protein [Legionella israelensis]|uniref:Synaptobrevin n=1 Tax=Legionella israelensis TaxID=454 RepID=A0A0W0W1N7_9GAMM|nr:R-SNARE family protein [Legionella israelensis]KTD26207.1 Synaptobrevin [Legionella israelensis]QBS10057.1 hypothetical protein E4T55_09445 [Legionella israelensis]SCY58537.1 Synaptobrevin [Legionella israelensis DSM 19235]STX59641.1 Synaptobrevin [Legionella israelensis]
MKCYAIAVKFGAEKMEWVTAHSSLWTSVFFQNMEKYYELEVEKFLQGMKPGDQHIAQKNGYCLHAQRHMDDYCIIITDQLLSRGQLAHLTTYLLVLEEKVNKSIVFKDFEQYCSDRKLRQIKEELEETKKIMTDNIDKLLERGERIEQLIEKTEELSRNAKQFKHEAEELNRCWPSCTIL